MLSKNSGEIDVVSIPINMLTIVSIKYEKYFCRVGLRNLSFRFGGVGWGGGHEPKIFGHSSKKYNKLQK